MAERIEIFVDFKTAQAVQGAQQLAKAMAELRTEQEKHAKASDAGATAKTKEAKAASDAAEAVKKETLATKEATEAAEKAAVTSARNAAVTEQRVAVVHVASGAEESMARCARETAVAQDTASAAAQRGTGVMAQFGSAMQGAAAQAGSLVNAMVGLAGAYKLIALAQQIEAQRKEEREAAQKLTEKKWTGDELSAGVTRALGVDQAIAGRLVSALGKRTGVMPQIAAASIEQGAAHGYPATGTAGGIVDAVTKAFAVSGMETGDELADLYRLMNLTGVRGAEDAQATLGQILSMARAAKVTDRGAFMRAFVAIVRPMVEKGIPFTEAAQYATAVIARKPYAPQRQIGVGATGFEATQFETPDAAKAAAGWAANMGLLPEYAPASDAELGAAIAGGTGDAEQTIQKLRDTIQRSQVGSRGEKADAKAKRLSDLATAQLDEQQKTAAYRTMMDQQRALASFVNLGPTERYMLARLMADSAQTPAEREAARKALGGGADVLFDLSAGVEKAVGGIIARPGGKELASAWARYMETSPAAKAALASSQIGETSAAVNPADEYLARIATEGEERFEREAASELNRSRFRLPREELVLDPSNEGTYFRTKAEAGARWREWMDQSEEFIASIDDPGDRAWAQTCRDALIADFESTNWTFKSSETTMASVNNWITAWYREVQSKFRRGDSGRMQLRGGSQVRPSARRPSARQPAQPTPEPAPAGFHYPPFSSTAPTINNYYNTAHYGNVWMTPGDDSPFNLPGRLS